MRHDDDAEDSEGPTEHARISESTSAIANAFVPRYAYACGADKRRASEYK
jgi:hypothetical protein